MTAVVRRMRTRGLWAGLIAAVLLLGAWWSPSALLAESTSPPGTTAQTAMPTWPEGVVEAFRTVPIQQDGRVKPLSTYARYALLEQNGRMTYRTAADVKRTPTEWLLEVLLTPEFAANERTFQVQNDEVLDAIGLAHEGRKKRDRYSFSELFPVRQKLLAKSQEYTQIESKDRTPVEAQVVALANAFFEFDALARFLDPLRAEFPIGDAPELRAIMGGKESVRYSDVVRNIRQVGELWGRLQHERAPDDAELAALDAFVRDLMERGNSPRVLQLLPPEVGTEDEEVWFSIADMLGVGMNTPYPVERTADALAALEGVIDSRGDPMAMTAHAEQFQSILSDLATERGENDTTELEAAYHQGDWFFKAQWLFVLGFLFAGLGWLFPNRTWTGVVMWLTSASGLALVTLGIVQRCIIRSRPPVSTLYETILFITGTAVAAALITEVINRRRIALATSTFLGALGMFLAYRFEMHEAKDTMPNLQAVLDTNFWLSTHVTTVTIGYSAGLFASAMAHVYLIGKMLGGRSGTPVPAVGGNLRWYQQPDMLKSISRMTYGLIAFCLVFSTVGTILGGIWANDSWGRFWGWDPKENGALMICLWAAIILHARMGGFVRDTGIAVMSIVGGLVVGFSWWGVNLLGVGLHSYGFTSGAAFGLKVFYYVELAFLAVVAGHQLIGWLMRRSTGTA